MTEHLSTLQVEQLCASALPEDDLVAAARHTAECQSCHRRFVEELQRQRGSAPFAFTLDPEFWFRDDHVDFELLVALADKSLDQETEEIINIHLRTCETCSEDVRSFLAYRARERESSHGQIQHQHMHQTGSAPWWHRLQSRSIYALAAIVLVAIAVLIGVIAFNKRSSSLETSKQDQANPGVEPGPIVASAPTPNGIRSPPTGGDSVEVAKLNDVSGEITIDTSGRVTGLDQISDDTRQHIARAALSERIEPAEVLRRLSGEQSGLRGEENAGQRFKLLYPVRSVVIEDRPVFRWESLASVSSYRVYVLDADGKQVGQSEELPANQTQWKAPARLRRGQIFSWVVTAMVDGRKVVSPSASGPEMKFGILATADFQELVRLKKSNSHLAVGVFYARTGLLSEAEREFQRLVELNPKSELASKLLQSVRSSMRQPN